MASHSAALLRDETGASAVEFALIAPVMFMLLFGIIGYGYVFGLYHGVQQIAAEAARASVAGLNESERERIARDFVAQNAGAYAFLDPSRLRVTTRQNGAPSRSFEVAVVYDMSGTLFDQLSTLVALPSPLLERRAVIQRGGY